jgi:riboflavin kinase / FMN adenylyltransferase
MRHYWAIEGIQLEESWITIGSFDGIHRGHQEIVALLTAGAHQVGAPAVVLTFYPHPSYVLGKREGPLYLTTPEERAEILGTLGVDIVITHPFTKSLAALTAREFILLLKENLNLRKLLVGYDFALGRKREGNVQRLTELGQELGYSLDILSPVEQGGQVVSSSQIRQLLLDGKVGEAADLLGRPHRITGNVIRGDSRGRQLGIPTANLDIWGQIVIPKSGVYACRAHVKGQSYLAVTNVGLRPTVSSSNLSIFIEAHLLEFSDDIYSQPLRLDFLHRLRDEQRFPNLQALVAQIHQDIGVARQLYEPVREDGG